MIRVGIAGIGAIARNYLTHFANNQIKDAKLCALSSRAQANMDETIATLQLQGVLTFTSYEEMIKSGEIDAVLICTPHLQHPKMALLAAKCGVHILVEKPIGVYPDEVSELVSYLDEHPAVVNGVLYNKRLARPYQKAKELVAELGDLKRISWLITNMYRSAAYFQSSPWRGKYESEGGGILMTQTSHHLDLLQWLCGMPDTIQGNCYVGVNRDIEVENEVTMFFEYESGARGQFIASSHECPGSNRLEISGQNGLLIIENDRTVTYHRLDISETEFNAQNTDMFNKVPYQTEVLDFSEDDMVNQQEQLIQNFIDCINGQAEMICSVKEAAYSLAFIQGCYLSDWTHSKVVLPLDEDKFLEQLKKQCE